MTTIIAAATADDDADGGQPLLRRGDCSAFDEHTDDVLDLEKMTDASWALFRDKVANSDVQIRDCNIMLKARANSGEMRHHIDMTMRAAAIAPDVVTFTHLVRQLILEENRDAARRVSIRSRGHASRGWDASQITPRSQ